jgi:hypothetical protein
MKILMNLALAALLANQAFAWNPEVCNGNDFAGRARFEAFMRAAKPGDPVYVPKPFPHNNNEVIEDFFQQAQDKVNRPSAPFLEPGQRALRRAMEQGTLHIGIVREANWRNYRCALYRSGETVYLLRLYDTATGTEIARAAIEESGLMNAIMYPLDRTTPIWSKPLLTLPEAEQLLNSAVGKVVDVQYATSHGTIGCDEWLPCVAGRLVGHDGYAIVSYNGIYTFDVGSRRIDQSASSAKDKASVGSSMRSFEKVLHSLGPHEGLTTVGSNYDVIATKVADRP